MKRITLHIIFLLLIFSACKPKVSDKDWSAGDIDPTTFVAVGGSSTAGYCDDALYGEGQEYSLGNLLAKQLEKVGGGAFFQPIIDSWSDGCNAEGYSSLELGYKTDCLGVTSLSPIRKAASGNLSVFQTNVYNGELGNYGIPLLKSTDLTAPGYGQTNPYFARMASNPSTDQVLGSVMNRQPTFFSFFVGVDEITQFAKKGSSGGTLTPVEGADGIGFRGSISNALDLLCSNGAKGVVANLPDVTDFPFFTTIPYNGLNLNEEKAASLNQIYNPIGLYFQVGPNPFVILDPNAGTFGVRFMEPDEKVLLSVPLDSVKCYQMGSVFPFRDEFVLTHDELTEIQQRILDFNAVLLDEANQHNLAFVDTYSWGKSMKNGTTYNGINMSLKFVSGGLISLDGLHLTPRGNALLCNEFIRSINEYYHASIPKIDATKHRANLFP